VLAEATKDKRAAEARKAARQSSNESPYRKQHERATLERS
jgi:hypothetical protein